MSLSEAIYLNSDIEAFPEYSERFLRISTTRGGELVPLCLNDVQRWIHRKFVVPTWNAGKPVRLCILKMRQSGVSTYVQGLLRWYATGGRHRNCMVAAKKEKQAEKIFKIFQRFHNNIPDNNVLPDFPIHRETKSMMEFGKPKYFRKHERKNKVLRPVVLDSQIECVSAEDRESLGRSETFHFVHASEVAYWPPPLVGAMSSLMACVHPEPHTFLALETTANGYNEFYSFWSNLTIDGKNVSSDWQRVFIPWYWDTRYEEPVLDKKVEPESEDEDDFIRTIMEDKEISEIIGRDITEGDVKRKLLWRRKAIVDKCFGDVDYFKQEFPSTSFEAFRFSGVTVFSTYRMTQMERTISEPMWRGDIRMKIDRGDSEGS